MYIPLSFSIVLVLDLGAQLLPQWYLLTRVVLLGPGTVSKLSRHIFNNPPTHPTCVHPYSCPPHEDPPQLIGGWLKLHQWPLYLTKPTASTSFHQQVHRRQETSLIKKTLLSRIGSTYGRESTCPRSHRVKLTETLCGAISISQAEEVRILLTSGPPGIGPGTDRRGQCSLIIGHRNF